MLECDYKDVRAQAIYIDEGPKRAALKRLHERMDAGESPFEILGIDSREKYYVDKLVSGLCPMSYALYGRILNLDEEDDFSK